MARSRGKWIRALATALVVASIAVVASHPAVATYGGSTSPAVGRRLPAGPVLLLTFDDGPSERYTPAILAELQKRKLHALFFVNGKNLVGKSKDALARREILRAEAAAGNLIGNHTYDHANLCAKGSKPAKIAAEIDENAALIEAEVGYTPFLFRPPYGNYHCRRVEVALAARHLTPIGWTIDSQDWKVRNSRRELGGTEGQIAEWLKETRRFGRFGIILMHDSQADTVRALPALLDWVDGQNALRATQGLPPIEVGGPSYLVPPLDEAVTRPVGMLVGHALDWVRSIRWPEPLAPLATVL